MWSFLACELSPALAPLVGGGREVVWAAITVVANHSGVVLDPFEFLITASLPILRVLGALRTLVILVKPVTRTDSVGLTILGWVPLSEPLVGTTLVV